MQCLPVEFGLIWTDSVMVLSIRIDAIANQWVAYMGHMDANLMRTACLQCAFDHGRFGKGLRHAVMGNGVAALCFGQYSHFLAIRARPANLRADRAGGRGRDAAYNGDIFAFDVMCSEQLCQAFMRGIAFCNHEKA